MLRTIHCDRRNAVLEQRRHPSGNEYKLKISLVGNLKNILNQCERVQIVLNNVYRAFVWFALVYFH